MEKKMVHDVIRSRHYYAIKKHSNVFCLQTKTECNKFLRMVHAKDIKQIEYFVLKKEVKYEFITETNYFKRYRIV